MTSVGGSASTAIDAAVSTAISKGIHFVVAAGNSNIDASNVSPARVAAAITVGTASSSGVKSPALNYGAVVDVYCYAVTQTCPSIAGPSSWSTASAAGAAV